WFVRVRSGAVRASEPAQRCGFHALIGTGPNPAPNRQAAGHWFEPNNAHTHGRDAWRDLLPLTINPTRSTSSIRKTDALSEPGKTEGRGPGPNASPRVGRRWDPRIATRRPASSQKRGGTARKVTTRCSRAPEKAPICRGVRVPYGPK